MTRGVELTWEGGEHCFLLTIPLLRALQHKCDAGPLWVLGRLQSGQWLIEDVIETLRLGLEGGGMDKDDARRLIARLTEDDRIVLTRFVTPAIAVLMEALYGLEDDPPGKPQAGGRRKATTKKTRSRAENGASRNSTEPPASSGSTSTA